MRVSTVALVIGSLGMAVAPIARAQTSLTLAFASATTDALKGGDGATLDLIRKNDLMVIVQGDGGFDAMMLAFAIKEGAVANRWNSTARVSLLPGSNRIRGEHFVPQDYFLRGDQFTSGDRFLSGARYIDASDALEAFERKSVAVFLDRQTASQATGLLLVLVPAPDPSQSARRVETRPVFVTPELSGDP